MCTDEIFASKASIIGSIGVISAGFGFDKALNKIGVDRRIYTAGKNKSLLDPLPENKDIKRLKNLQTKLHEHFISFVTLRRGKIDLKNKDLFTECLSERGPRTWSNRWDRMLILF